MRFLNLHGNLKGSGLSIRKGAINPASNVASNVSSKVSKNVKGGRLEDNLNELSIKSSMKKKAIKPLRYNF
jgi:hypothetical protein